MNTITRLWVPTEINAIFANDDPVAAWNKAIWILQSINSNIDLSHLKTVFDDVICLFNGAFPGYGPILTPYHDLPHTLDVFICTTRLLHGVHLSGIPFTDEEISLMLIAALLHDVGYAQENGKIKGTGARHTQIHVQRGISFMERYLNKWALPAEWQSPLAQIILSTDLRVHLSDIVFPNPRQRLLAQIVGSADLVGQMADRAYLEKLLFLHLEFKEANYANCENKLDIFKNTRIFYESICVKLNSELGGVYQRLNDHFKAWLGEDKNFYMESIERNISYLDSILDLREADFLTMLKRHGIVENFTKISNGT